MVNQYFSEKFKIVLISDHTILFKVYQHVDQIMYGETLDFQFQHQYYGNIKCQIGKSIFAVNLSLNLFRATAANAYIGSLKSLHILFNTYLDHMLVKFEWNCMVQNKQILTFLTKISCFFGSFWQNVEGIQIARYWYESFQARRRVHA